MLNKEKNTVTGLSLYSANTSGVGKNDMIIDNVTYVIGSNSTASATISDTVFEKESSTVCNSNDPYYEYMQNDILGGASIF